MTESTTVTNPITLSSNDKEKLDKLVKDLSKTERKNGEYYFHNFVDYYQLPQIIRVEQTWNTNLIKNQWLSLQALFNRYLIQLSILHYIQLYQFNQILQ
ncbi:unnamed protein product [Adineta steineri]|uniref:Uncharacterized protein n=1 Tax=Adineta steineri TaxID=433720 RepID=A0A820G1V4_9BILA|nr:unnamed protein product [Adineta steineri]CAF4270591.1 unnamed protein product [Adineta steineri]